MTLRIHRYSRVELIEHLHDLLFYSFRCLAGLRDDEAVEISDNDAFVAVVGAVLERDQFGVFLL